MASRSVRPDLTLTLHLQSLTERLAAAHTQAEVVEITLAPAITALDARSGALFLLDGDQLHLANAQAVDDQSLWHRASPAPQTPTGDVILHRQARYFEHAGELAAAYPHIVDADMHHVPVATAFVPLLLADRVLGVLILGFRDPHPFPLQERQFLSTLAGQCSLALDRAEVLQRLTQEKAALQTSAERFQHLVEASPVGMAVGSHDGRLTLVNDTYLNLLGYTRAEFQAGEIDWQALTPTEYQALDTQAFGAAFTQGISPAYEKEMLTKDGRRLPLSVTLIRMDDQQVVGYLQDLRVLRAQQQLFRDERAQLQGQVAQGEVDLGAEQAALRAFVSFTEAASRTDDLDELCRLVVWGLAEVLPGSVAGLYEWREPEARWYVRQHAQELSDDLVAALNRGVAATVPVFAELEDTRRPVFIDRWNAEEQGVPYTEGFEAVAAYPVQQQEHLRAALTVALPAGQAWDARSRSVVEAMGRSFTLLHDRVSASAQLHSQKEEAQRRAQVLEAFMQLTAVQPQNETPLELVARTQELVLSLLPPGFAAYYEPEDDRWRLRVQTGEAGGAALQSAMETGFPVGRTPSFDQVAESAQPAFVDVYVNGMDVDPEVAAQVSAHATLPLMVGGVVRGLFNVPLFQTRIWAAADRALLVMAVHSLGIAMERAERTSALAQANLELQTSNGELEAFTYSASHDLRTPVRHVKGFGDLALRALDQGQEARVRRHLGVVSEAADRMTAMIDGMLTLSRVGRADMQMRAVSLTDLVRQAQQDAELEFPEREVVWELGGLPTVQGDAAVLQQVMTNLLSNAVKFADAGRLLHVRVWAEERPDAWAVLVRDNGVGFDARYAGKLFGAFQRLHTHDAFAGTGIGLATVRRIVTRHGGQVWADGQLGVGATFGFTLPREPVSRERG